MYDELSDAFNNAHVQFMLNEKSNSYFCVFSRNNYQKH